ncbi:MAG: TipAS antibiotic-recognition domain-containing protein [Massilia sp.]|nr:TipAS antibiotic-recognition domain-containing protein [Massilia sp.]
MTLKNSASEYLEQCRQALAEQQAKSLAETENWSHVDKQQVHIDWDLVYKELATVVEGSLPSSPEAQAFISRHHSIAVRFYKPSREAYIGLGLFYQDNPDIRAYHTAFHPKMVEFLGEAIYVYAQRNL